MGRFSPGAVHSVCVSSNRAPVSKRSKVDQPSPSAMLKPTADHSEYRPPTQSHSGKHRSSGICHSPACATCVVTAIKWRPNASSLMPAPSSHSRARAALERVSSVVKDFEQITNSVLRGSSAVSVRSKSSGSMLATKWVRSGIASLPSASQIRRGPRSEPPIPRLTTSVKRWSSVPRHSPQWMASTSVAIRDNVVSTALARSAWASVAVPRSSVCRAGLRSELLTCCP